jgi:hypothetical protein
MKHLIILSILLGLLISSFGCTTDNPEAPQYTPIADPGNQPIVTSVSTIPPGLPYVLAGVQSIAINGTNLVTDSSKIQVFVGNTLVTKCTYTPTRISFLAPNVIKDSIIVRVLVAGAIKFSDVMYVSIRSPLSFVSAIDTAKQVPNAITFDRNGNLFVSVTTMIGVSDGIYKVSAGGAVSQYALKGTEVFFSGLKCRGDSVYAARRANRLVSRNSLTGAMTIFTASFPTAAFPTNIEDMDYDQNKLLWAGGNTTNGGLISVDSQKNVKQYPLPFGGIIHSVRVYSSSVYCSVEAGDGTKGVYKIPINADKTLGTATKYFDLSATVGNTTNNAYGITFDNQGNMYIGTDAPAGVYVVAPDQSVQPLYGGLLGPNCKYLAWGNDSYLYIVRATLSPLNSYPTGVYKVDMVGKLSAPYYGQ